MDAKLKQKWVKALRSGKYKQQRGGIGYDNMLCCIGVCGDVAGIDQNNTNWLTYRVASQVGLSDTEADVLVKMNDDEGKSFPEIADYIEQNL